MARSPGHQKWPEHKVLEEPAGEAMQVEIDGEVIAESNDVLKVSEDEHVPRYYFPRADVKMGKLEASATETECPFKGKASYFTVNVGGRQVKDGAWSYEDPYDEHQALKGRLAFYDDKHPEIRVRAAKP
jgi:uncharacterized protein (DUF427 family)